jgi:raffinose/stachyose/melibiose transport system permease protein
MISRTERTTNYAILSVFAVVALAPIVGILLAALAPPGQPATGITIPRHPSVRNFSEAWTVGHFGAYLRSSAIVTGSVLVAATFLSILAGYAFGTMRFRGNKALFYLLLLGIMIPEEAIIVPLYYDLRQIHLTETYWAIILPQIAQSVAFGTFWMRAFFRSMPGSIVEAARIDGASTWRILWRILVPFGRPAILTMMVLISMWTWNEFLLPLVMVSSENLRTAPLGLAFFQGQHTSEFALLAAGAVIVAAPILTLYVFFQRHFIRGMLSGAVKG